MEDYMAKEYDFQKYLETHASKSSAPKSLKEDQEAKREQSQKNQKYYSPCSCQYKYNWD